MSTYHSSNIVDIPSYIVFSDMDGTLLDHDTYCYLAAETALAHLKKIRVQVVPNTSKTFDEIIDLRARIGLTDAFIVENGAAVYIPRDLITACPEDCTEQGDFYVKKFARPRDFYLELLKSVDPVFKFDFIAFSEMTNKQLVNYTGLSETDAIKAKRREFGEPIKWLSDASKKSKFIEHLQNLGGNVVEGGRFIHFGDKTDKSIAMRWYTDFVSHLLGTQHTSIALGDGNNDLEMLEKADISVAVKSPVNPKLKLKKSKNVYFTERLGPEGWAESINKLILQPRGLL